jgi:excisionase family DNA binding protein
MSTKISGNVAGPQTGPQPRLNLLTLKEVAGYARVSISTVRRWVSDDGLPVYRAGRQKRVDEKELVKFLSGGE